MEWSIAGGGLLRSLDAAVLGVLTRTSRPLTGREVSRLALHGSPAGVQRALDRLTEIGLVQVTEAGRANLYVFNSSHVLSDSVLTLLGLRDKVFAHIRGELASWAIPSWAAAVFGSAARSQANTASDVDILVIVPDGDYDHAVWDDQISSLSQLVRGRSGNPASIIQLTREEMAAAIDRGERLIDDLRRDAIPLTDRSVLGNTPDAGSTQ